jgi:hypothetical protein
VETTIAPVVDEVVSYSAILEDINNNLCISNNINVVLVIAVGVMVGVLLGVLFWGRFH